MHRPWFQERSAPSPCGSEEKKYPPYADTHSTMFKISLAKLRCAGLHTAPHFRPPLLVAGQDFVTLDDIEQGFAVSVSEVSGGEL